MQANWLGQRGDVDVVWLVLPGSRLKFPQRRSSSIKVVCTVNCLLLHFIVDAKEDCFLRQECMWRFLDRNAQV